MCGTRHLQTDQPTAKFARASPPELKAAGWKLERVLTDTGNEFRSHDFQHILTRLHARHSRIHAGRPLTNGNVEALHKTILDECWRPRLRAPICPRYTGLRRDLGEGAIAPA